MSAMRDVENMEVCEWYIAVGYHKGSLYHSSIYWDHYVMKGTKTQAQNMYAKKTLERENWKISLREFANEQYFCADEVTDEMVKEFLETRHLHKSPGEYNDGWKMLSEMTESDWGKYFVKEEPTVIQYDENFSYDKEYGGVEAEKVTSCPGCEYELDADKEHKDMNGEYHEDCYMNKP